MASAHDEDPPVLVLDEFTDLGIQNENLKAMDLLMRQCLNKNFFLIITTSKEEVADELVYLNGWGKMKPLQAVHDGCVFVEHEENEKLTWKAITWTPDQLKKVGMNHVKGDLGTCNFCMQG